MGRFALLLVLGLVAVAAVHAHPWLLVVAAVVVVPAVRARRAAGGSGGVAAYHSHPVPESERNTRYYRDTYAHEGGHVHAAKKLGSRVRGARVFADGSGVTYADRHPDPVKDIAISWAGQFAAGTSRGCGGDQGYVRSALRGVPRAERARVAREGKALGRRLGRQSRSRPYARRLERDGHL